jgi:quercetin dioxygenase-like cupin family protein
MSAVHIVALGDGELVDVGTTLLEILEDGSNTAHRLGVARVTVPGKTPGPPQHKHREHDEGFLVTRGRLVFKVGGEVYDAPTGTFVMVPIGEPHTFENPFDEEAELVSTFTPDFYVNYFRDLRELAKGPGLSFDAVKQLMAKYATDPVF